MGWIGGSYITPVERVEQSATGFVPGIGGGPEEAEQVVPYTNTMSDFRVQLNSLLKEHTVLASEYLKNIHDNKDGAAFKTQLDQNTEILSEMVGEMYGNDARRQFQDLWNTHMAYYVSYTHALREGQMEEAQRAEDSLLLHAQRTGETMQQVDRNFSQARITDLMSEHVRLTLAVINAYAAGNDELLSINMKRAYDQAGEFADYLGQAIAASRPEPLQ